jgi:hypothetical protein
MLVVGHRAEKPGPKGKLNISDDSDAELLKRMAGNASVVETLNGQC